MARKASNHSIKIALLKQKGRKTVKTHYLILLITCLFAALVGSEFSDSLTVFYSETASLRQLITLPPAILEGGREIFGISNGIFASLITSFGSGSIYDSIFNAINALIGSEGTSAILFIFIGLLVIFVAWFFIGNMYCVIARRIFLESRLYEKVAPNRFLFLYHTKKWSKVSFAMFVRYIYLLLWFCVFLVGGIIKRYSYFLVPYLLAENPDLTAKEAITLSRNMMNGHKWNCFLLELSFIGWNILNIATLGLSGLFYSNAYQLATYSEYYVQIRDLAKSNNVLDVEKLNDTYLYEKAKPNEISKKYTDVLAILNAPKTQEAQPKNKLETILNFFGIALHRTENTDKRERELILENYAKDFENILSAKQYPTRLFPLPERSKRTKSETTNYMKKYTIPTLVFMFFIFSFIGWAWEVTLHLLHDGIFVNRGTMYGPWLPIYGSGGILILTILYKLRQNVLVQFFATVVLCGTIEYLTAYTLEMTHNGTKWWDYSGYFLNLHGRICGEGLLVFGLGAIAVVYLLAPVLDNYINRINSKVLVTLCGILVALFVADSIYSGQHPNSGAGITSGTAPASSASSAAIAVVSAEANPADWLVFKTNTPFTH